MRINLIYFKNESNYPKVAIAEVIGSENIPSFLSDTDRVHASTIKSLNYRSQWIAVRMLLKEILPEAEGITYDEKGKPFLLNSDLHISLSHTADLVAICISDKPCGIDLEILGEKVLRIKDRFMNDSEATFATDPLSMHIIWGVKECVFKHWGKGNVEFKSEIIVLPFSSQSDSSGDVLFRNERYKFRFEKIGTAMLVYLH